MNEKEVIHLLDKIMLGDDWILTEPEEGLILLQREGNKATLTIKNLKSR